ncbi:unnamed protein product [Clonostachys chloroleuca]|uniref:Uncharacterized protein n=1 Tax=Clonostachys chloroleuca TaxID=1926264 RepID=A0AA35VBU8_9HYPO|nr:unnamed protein product [Clonostachys chloroleuca]
MELNPTEGTNNENSEQNVAKLKESRAEFDTRISGNSYEVMAQAAQYSVKYYTSYIALFDWGHFVLAVMEQAYRL